MVAFFYWYILQVLGYKRGLGYILHLEYCFDWSESYKRKAECVHLGFCRFQMYTYSDYGGEK
jgi:hypothetical protein